MVGHFFLQVHAIQATAKLDGKSVQFHPLRGRGPLLTLMLWALGGRERIEKGREESRRRGGLSLYPCSLVREANTSWHPWNPFLICWLKVMGRGKETGNGRDRRGTAGEFCVQNQPQFGNYPPIIFFSLPGCCWHILWSCWEGHSAVMSVQILFLKEGRHHLLQRLELASHIVNQIFCVEACYFDEPEGIWH